MKSLKISEKKERSEKQPSRTLHFNEQLIKSLEVVTRFFPWIEFVISYGFAIQTVWITILMIVDGTPNIVDAFIWILPNIIAILLRPYLITYVHSIKHKVYRQIRVLIVSLIVGGLGGVLVALSCQYKIKNKQWRIMQCALGWTLMDVGFQFAEFFRQKIIESYEELQQGTVKSSESSQQRLPLIPRDDYCFYGTIIGYLVGIILCYLSIGRKMKNFYQINKWVYISVALLSILSGLKLFIDSKLHLPPRKPEDSNSSQKIEVANTEISFYLPGYHELLNADIKTSCLLLLHFIVNFVNDVVLIYATLWPSEASQIKITKQGQLYFNGIIVGSIYLILYTFISTIQFDPNRLNNPIILQIILLFVSLSAFYSFYKYSTFSFLIFCLSVAVLNQFYNATVCEKEKQQNILFDRCIEIVERAEKIFVLCPMPVVVLLILNRDDVSDCIFWCGCLILLGLLLFIVSLKPKEIQDKLLEGEKRPIKVKKVE